MRKMIVSDMDGTLLTDQKTLLPETISALIKQQEEGTLLVLASGRIKTRMMEYAKILKMDVFGGYFIEANGSVIYDLKKDHREIIRSMSYQEADELFKYLRKNYPNYEIMIMGDINAYVNLPIGVKESTFFNSNNMESLKNRDIIYIQSVYEIKELFYKVCIYKDPKSIVSVMQDVKNTFSNTYWCGRTMPFWLEIMPKEINKGNALKKLMHRLNIDSNNIFVFGDGENDLSMLKLGNSIAMGNALDSVKKECMYITLSNEENGIAHFINTQMKEKL